jgi:hypothetical protein
MKYKEIFMNLENNPYATSDAITQPMDLKQEEVLRHTGVGITSLVISILSVIIMLTAIILCVLGAANRTDPKNLLLMLGGFTVFLTIFVQLIGMVLGIVGLFQKGIKKILPILGLVISGAGLIVIVSILIIGLIAKGNF